METKQLVDRCKVDRHSPRVGRPLSRSARVFLVGTALTLSFLAGDALVGSGLIGSAGANESIGGGTGAGGGLGGGGLGVGAGVGLGVDGGSGTGTGSGGTGTGTGTGTGGVGAGAGVGVGDSGTGTGSSSSGTGTGSAGTGTGTGTGTGGVNVGAGLGLGLGNNAGVGIGAGLGIGPDGTGTGGGGTGTGGAGNGTGGTGTGGGTGTAGGGTGVGSGSSGGSGGVGVAAGGDALGNEGLGSGSSGGDIAGLVPSADVSLLGDIAPAASSSPALNEWRSRTHTLSAVQPCRFAQGAVVFLSTGGFVKTVGTDGCAVTTVNAAHNVVTRPGGFFTPRSGSLYDANAVASLWPLKVGKSVRFVQHLDKDAWQQTIKVLRTETITVPAGRFDTFVVQRESRGLAATNFLATYTYWYAPNPGAIVKFNVQQTAGAAMTEKPWVAVRLLIPEATQVAN